MADRSSATVARRLVDDPSCVRSTPALPARSIGAERQLPEAAAGRQQRVVGDEVRLVGRLRGAKLRAAEVPVDLAADRVERRLERRDVLGLLAEHDLAHDRLDVLVGQRDLHREAVGQLLQRGRRRQRALAGGDEQHLALEARRAALDDVLDGERLLVVVADVLLHLVEHDQGERQLALAWSTGGGGRRPSRRTSRRR